MAKLDRMQRASVEAIRGNDSPVSIEVGSGEGQVRLTLFCDRQLSHDIALAVQSYFDRMNHKTQTII